MYTVRVAKGRGPCLHMQQVQVFDQSGINIALASAGGAASQSSEGWGGRAELTIDGNVDDNACWPHGGHTQVGPDEWWQVKLPGPTDVSRIVVYNRADGFRERLVGARVTTLNANGAALQEFVLTQERLPFDLTKNGRLPFNSISACQGTAWAGLCLIHHRHLIRLLRWMRLRNNFLSPKFAPE